MLDSKGGNSGSGKTAAPNHGPASSHQDASDLDDSSMPDDDIPF
jgi:hypothetical protein